jgi:hypothetical protein
MLSQLTSKSKRNWGSQFLAEFLAANGLRMALTARVDLAAKSGVGGKKWN